MNISQISPLSDYILVEPSTKEDVTASGIVIPDTAAKERPEQGRVLAVGPGAVDEKNNIIPMEIKTGQTVLFTKYGPTEIKIDNQAYLFIRQKDVLAVLTN